MTTILISPFSRSLRNGNFNPKNYPYWPQLVDLLNNVGVNTVQIGMKGEPILPCKQFGMGLSMEQLKNVLPMVDGFISVDNFFPHFCNYHKKYGAVIFGKSDPNIFGYPENLNILKDRSYLRPFQYAGWDDEPYSEEAFIGPNELFQMLLNRFDFSSVVSINFNDPQIPT